MVSVSPVRDFVTFVSSAVRSPAVIGAVAPSGRALSDLLASVAPAEGQPVVVELGPGTGVVSAALRRRLPEGARHIAVEIDPGMVEHLRRTRPWLEVVEGDAADLQKLLADIGVDQVDAVDQRPAVDAVPGVGAARDHRAGHHACSPPGAPFTTFAYSHVTRLPTQRRFRGVLESEFSRGAA